MADTEKLFVAAQRWWTGEGRWPREVGLLTDTELIAQSQAIETRCDACGRSVHVDCRCGGGE